MTSAHPDKYYLGDLDSPQEQARLDQQARALYDLLDGNVVHSRLPPNPKLILDVGCGTGSMSLSLAFRNPSASILGVDLSRVPETHVTPPNVMYVQGDILDLLGKDPRFPNDTADLIFGRLLGGGFAKNKWQEYVNAAAKALKPGGSLEAHEVAVRFFKEETDAEGKRVAKRDDPEWLTAITSAMGQKGVDPDIGLNLPDYMKTAGLKSISVKVYKWAIGDWLKDREPKTEAIGIYSRDSLYMSWVSLLENLLKDSHSADEIKRLQDQVRLTMQEPGRWMNFYVVTGQRPV